MKSHYFHGLFLALCTTMLCLTSPVRAGEWVIDHYKYERYEETKYAGADGESYNPPHLWTIVGGERDGNNLNMPPRVVSATIAASLANQNDHFTGGGGLAATYVTAATIPAQHLSMRYKVTPYYEWSGDGEPATEFWAREWGHLSVMRSRWGEGISYSAGNPYHGEGITIHRAFNGFENIPVGPDTDDHSDIYFGGQNIWSYCQSSFNDWPIGRWKFNHYTVSNGATKFTGPSRVLEASITIDASTAGATQVSTETSIRSWYVAEVCKVSLDATPLGPYTAVKEMPMDKEYDAITRWKVKNTDDGIGHNDAGPVIEGPYTAYHVDPFMGGQSDFFATAKTGEGADIFPNQKYIWHAQKAPYVAVVPPPPLSTQPSVVYVKKALDAFDTYWMTGRGAGPNTEIWNYLAPGVPFTAAIPEYWPQWLDQLQLAYTAGQIPDSEKLETSTAGKQLKWDFGAAYSAPQTSTKVQVQVTGESPGDPIVNVGKVKINWKRPRHRLYEIKVFPVEWRVPAGGGSPDDIVYTYFANEDLVSQINSDAAIQAALIAGGSAASGGPRVARVLLNTEKTALVLAEEQATGLVPQATPHSWGGAAGKAESGKFKVEVKQINESNEIVAGGEAATVEKTIIRATGGGCFVAGTPVLMASGSLTAIEKLRVGDSVIARDPTTGVTTAKRVTHTTVLENVHTLLLYLSDGQAIETTANHPFFVAGKNNGEWLAVPAGSLALGNSILTRAGPQVTLARVEETHQKKTVYNCSVDGFATYFVGQTGLWVHNTDPCYPAIDPPTNRNLIHEHMPPLPPGIVKPNAHHKLPFTFKDWFAAAPRGIDVNEYGKWVEAAKDTRPFGHQYWSRRYNDIWRAWILRNQQASRREVLEFMDSLDGQFPPP